MWFLLLGEKSKATKTLASQEEELGAESGLGAKGRSESEKPLWIQPWKWGKQRGEAGASEPGGGDKDGRGEENFGDRTPEG